ncbi:MAG: chorismate-binding protein [Pseudomonadales bacterium]|nr:chorismate-binding protein [Pseudomonadales bacterium]
MKRFTINSPLSIRQLFTYFCEEDWAVFFASAGENPASQFSFFATRPSQTLSYDIDSFKLEDCKRELRAALAHHRDAENPSLPFAGGWLGYASYELGYALDPLSGKPKQKNPSGGGTIPAFCAGFYPWTVVFNHAEQLTELICLDELSDHQCEAILHEINAITLQPQSFAAKAFSCDTASQQYHQDFASIQGFLTAGDCYQINYAQHYQAPYQGQPFAAFCNLADSVPSPFMAYINRDAFSLLSISPERFIRVEASKILSSPIKGTEKRSSKTREDLQLAQQLMASEKNRAENLMIVDLIRNDLGKHCVPGSISAHRLFEIESFANVHHLVSHIEGQLSAHLDAFDVFFDAFPGGSITGAPKQRAMQIINQLENFDRQIYCGSVFLASCHQRFDSNIAIRTLLCDKAAQTVHAWAGGGIVKDSELLSEYQECNNKIDKLLNAISH